MNLTMKLNEKEKEAFYNGYLDYSDSNGVAFESIRSKEELFCNDEEEEQCGKTIAKSEEDGSYVIIMDIKEDFIIEFLAQAMFAYCKFKAVIDAILPSTKAFIEKWTTKQYPNE